MIREVPSFTDYYGEPRGPTAASGRLSTRYGGSCCQRKSGTGGKGADSICFLRT
jgi:hypothetical protein